MYVIHRIHTTLKIKFLVFRVSKLEHVEDSKKQGLKELLYEYKDLFPDVPTRTNKIFDDVDVGDAKPVKQHPYRSNPVKQQVLKEEIQYLLENDFIEP